MDDLAQDLADFVTAAPTPYHAVAEAARRLAAAGFTEQPEAGPWSDEPGGRYLVRDGTVLAWYVPAAARPDTPMRIFAAHTDSPTLKVKPNPDVGRGRLAAGRGRGLRRSAVELLARPRSRPGRAARALRRPHRAGRRAPAAAAGAAAGHPPRPRGQLGRPAAGRAAAPAPGLGPGHADRGDLVEFLAAEAGVDPADVAAHDLVVHDVTPPARLGAPARAAGRAAAGQPGLSARRDRALLVAAEGVDDGPIPVFVGFDHEEIGSASATGAAGPLLETVLTRLAGGFDTRAAAFATSRCLSVDVTHAAHPNYLGHHDPGAPLGAQRRPGAQGQREPALRHRRPGCRGLATGLPRRRRADPDFRRPEHHPVRLDRRARSWPPGSASGPWTSASRCCPCTRHASCAGWTIPGTWPRRPPRSSPTPASTPVADRRPRCCAGCRDGGAGGSRPVRPRVGDLAGAPGTGAVGRRVPRPAAAVAAPAGDARDIPELGAVRSEEGLGPVPAHRRVRRDPDLRLDGRGAGGGRAGAPAARRAPRARPGHRPHVPARRARAAALGARHRDRLLRRGRPPGRRP